MTDIGRPPAFDQFIATYKRVAESHDLDWDIPFDANGSVPKDCRWDLCDLTGTPKPPAFSLSNLKHDEPTLTILNKERSAIGLPLYSGGPISKDWQDLLKALTIRGLFEKRNGARHIYNGIIRPIRALATCCPDKAPWNLTAEDVAMSLGIIGKVDKSSKLRSLVEAQVVTLDDNGLSEACPLLGKRSDGLRNVKMRTSAVRKDIDDRRRADRLPGAKEFWEILRIILEEKPATFYDAMRFGAVELGVLMGLRVEETATIPTNPIIIKHYVDVRGESAVKHGGIGHTMFLRHFSEKQILRSAKSIVYAETTTSVLRMFEQETRRIVERIEQLTAPLRDRITAQIKTGRIFPEYELDEMVSLAEIYPRLTGNPFVYEGAHNLALAEKYREGLDPTILSEIHEYQNELRSQGAPFGNSFKVYMGRKQNRWIPRRKMETPGSAPAQSGKKPRLSSEGVLISELEDAVRENLATKLSDTEGFPLASNREMSIHDCLFLVPKRALGEGRNGGVCDVKRYAFVGRLTSNDIIAALSKPSVQAQTFFAKYGKPKASEYTLNSHSLRHMHNNELFAAGVADTIITHRFGRKSVAQSHEYDSRTLAQELADMDLPPGTADILIGPARDVFKLIANDRGEGPIVDEFRRIQKEEGDEAAIAFLAIEADGMQITPYGLCLNSFVVEPCPRHLECFGGCSHLFRTGQATETDQLKKLAGRYRGVLSAISSHPGSEAAKAKAQAQAELRLASIEQALSTKPGSFVFPDGEDLSRGLKDARTTGLIE